MDRRTRNAIIWGVVIIIEAIILKLSKSFRIIFYVILPIIAGFLLTESNIRFSIPKKSKRNLR